MRKNKLIILFFILLLIVFLAIYLNKKALYYYFNTNNQDKETAEVEKADKIKKKSVQQAFVLCEEKKDKENQELCLAGAALEEYNIDVCGLIKSDNLRTDCVNKINLNNTIKKEGLAECGNLTNYMHQKRCVEEIVALKNGGIDCEILTDSLKSACLTKKNYILAINNNDASLCELIPNTIQKANCFSRLNNIDLDYDADNDGLSFLQEYIYGTDPANPDTDNDGYLDGDEVNSGHSPTATGTPSLNI